MLLAVAPAFAAAQTNLKFKVTSWGNPLAGVAVTVCATSCQTQFTNSQGVAKFDISSSVNYTVTYPPCFAAYGTADPNATVRIHFDGCSSR